MLILGQDDESLIPGIDRRTFLRSGLIVGAATTLWWPGQAEAARHVTGREIEIKNMHTGEKFAGEYWYRGRYLPDAFKEIKHVLRDHRADEAYPMDPRLMDMLYVLQQRVESKENIRIYSGYRSPATNAKLRRMGRGVAKKSMHMMGQAIDFSIPDARLRDVRRQAISLKAGGVGYYPSSHFLHIDTGRVRHW